MENHDLFSKWPAGPRRASRGQKCFGLHVRMEIPKGRPKEETTDTVTALLDRLQNSEQQRNALKIKVELLSAELKSLKTQMMVHSTPVSETVVQSEPASPISNEVLHALETKRAKLKHKETFALVAQARSELAIARSCSSIASEDALVIIDAALSLADPCRCVDEEGATSFEKPSVTQFPPALPAVAPAAPLSTHMHVPQSIQSGTMCSRPATSMPQQATFQESGSQLGTDLLVEDLNASQTLNSRPAELKEPECVKVHFSKSKGSRVLNFLNLVGPHNEESYHDSARSAPSRFHAMRPKHSMFSSAKTNKLPCAQIPPNTRSTQKASTAVRRLIEIVDHEASPASTTYSPKRAGGKRQLSLEGP